MSVPDTPAGHTLQAFLEAFDSGDHDRITAYETSLQLLAPRACLINYGGLSGPVPAINLHQLFSGSFFVMKYNERHWVEGVSEFAALISDGLNLATRRPAIISDVAGRFALNQIIDAYRELESTRQSARASRSLVGRQTALGPDCRVTRIPPHNAQLW